MRTSVLLLGLLFTACAACAAPPSIIDRDSDRDDEDGETRDEPTDTGTPKGGSSNTKTSGSNGATPGAPETEEPTTPAPAPTPTTTSTTPPPPPPPPPPPAPLTSITVTWPKISDQSYYSLDVQQASGAWTAPCIGSPILKKSVSAQFDGSCPSGNNAQLGLNVKAFRICWAHEDNWAVANCLTRPYTAGQATLNIKF